ncbi:hypothetical protein Slin14017_G002710 [Septoria linicola]|nr:hypothetical protein Slin14017_G002710 [Septoria linicola]
MASLNALAPVFDEKAYWKAREARAKAEISASKIPTGPRSKASNSRISSTGTVFGAKSIDHRPATARKNDRMNRARIGYTGKSPASTSGYNPHRLSSPGSTSTATSRGRRDTVTSIEEHTFVTLPSPFNSRMV